MSQRERALLVVLKKVQKKLITQWQAAVERQLSERQVRRLLVRLREVGDRRLCMGCASGRRSGRRAEPDISNWHTTGHFYLALTGRTRHGDLLAMFSDSAMNLYRCRESPSPQRKCLLFPWIPVTRESYASGSAARWSG